MGAKDAEKVAKKRREREKRLEEYRSQNRMKKGFTPEEKKKGKAALYFLVGIIVVVATIFFMNMGKN